VGSLIGFFKQWLTNVLVLACITGAGQAGMSQAAAQSVPEMTPAVSCPGPEILDQQRNLSELLILQRDLSLQSIEQACRLSANYLWLRGLIARQLGDASGASTWFELSMLRQPHRAGVLLDFAMTREAMGDLLSAKSIYQSLLSDHDPPQALRALIVTRLAVVEASLRERPATYQQTFIGPDSQSLRSSSDRLVTQQAILTGQIGISHGYDSNLNSASSLRALNFLIEDQVFSLEIPERDQPQAGRFQMLYSRLSRQSTYEGGRWGISMRQSLRATENSRFRSGALELGADASYGLVSSGPLAGELQAYLGKQWLGLDQAVVLRSERLAMSYELSRKLDLAGRECSFQFAIEAEQRRYPSRQVLDGNLLHRGVRVLCGGDSSRAELFSRIGRDEEQDISRAGGGQSKQEWGVVWIKEYTNQMMRLHWFSSKSVDERGYNPLIDNNKTRSVSRNNFGIEWAVRIPGRRFEPYVAYEKTDQASTISIFSYLSWQVMAGLRWSY